MKKEDTELSTDLGNKLKNLRQERELTLDMVIYDMNKKFNIEMSKGHLSKWENGKNTPSLYYAKYLCLYYGISMDYLLGLTDKRTPVDLLIGGKKNESH